VDDHTSLHHLLHLVVRPAKSRIPNNNKLRLKHTKLMTSRHPSASKVHSSAMETSLKPTMSERAIPFWDSLRRRTWALLALGSPLWDLTPPQRDVPCSEGREHVNTSSSRCSSVIPNRSLYLCCLPLW
jgi:hypothetical protein